MAKASKEIRGRQVQGAHGASFEQRESYDDSLLPDSAELEKLKQLDNEIIPWIKARTEKEQDARHNFTDRRLALIEGAQNKAYKVDVLSILCAFFLMGGGMFLSYTLLSSGQIVTGSIFGGATILFAARSFLNFRKHSPLPKNDKI